MMKYKIYNNSCGKNYSLDIFKKKRNIVSILIITYLNCIFFFE